MNRSVDKGCCLPRNHFGQTGNSDSREDSFWRRASSDIRCRWITQTWPNSTKRYLSMVPRFSILGTAFRQGNDHLSSNRVTYKKTWDAEETDGQRDPRDIQRTCREVYSNNEGQSNTMVYSSVTLVELGCIMFSNTKRRRKRSFTKTPTLWMDFFSPQTCIFPNDVTYE